MALNLAKQVGPLPLGAWVIVVGGGLGIAWWSRRNSAAEPVYVEDGSGTSGVGVGGGAVGWSPVAPIQVNPEQPDSFDWEDYLEGFMPPEAEQPPSWYSQPPSWWNQIQEAIKPVVAPPVYQPPPPNQTVQYIPITDKVQIPVPNPDNAYPQGTTPYTSGGQSVIPLPGTWYYKEPIKLPVPEYTGTSKRPPVGDTIVGVNKHGIPVFG